MTFAAVMVGMRRRPCSIDDRKSSRFELDGVAADHDLELAGLDDALHLGVPEAERLRVERERQRAPPAGREHLGLEPGERLVLTVGRLVEQKNHGLAIRALARVPDAVLAIAGDGPLRPSLERVAAEEGVNGRVRFLGVRPDVRALMGDADAIVLSSRWEGLPLSALEALASGTPLVATDVRGLRELVTDGQDALLVPEEPEALAAALGRVLDDSELAARLAEAGKRVEGAGSDDALVAGFLALYEKLAS